MRPSLGNETLDLTDSAGQTRRYHYVWLRDNCWCSECRVEQTAERRLLTWSIPEDIRATNVDSVNGGVVVDWSDGHRSTYSFHWLKDNDYSQPGLRKAHEQAFLWGSELTLPLSVNFDMVEPFYRSYRKLGNFIDSPEAKVIFKARNGDLLTVHGHRVLHGRMPFTPGTGARHLQDVYMEFDDFIARRRVLLGIHKPVPSGTSP